MSVTPRRKLCCIQSTPAAACRFAHQSVSLSYKDVLGADITCYLQYITLLVRASGLAAAVLPELRESV